MTHWKKVKIGNLLTLNLLVSTIFRNKACQAHAKMRNKNKISHKKAPEICIILKKRQAQRTLFGMSKSNGTRWANCF